ncbi:MAG: IclR family transcriptional regulator [Lacisediminihabitans sp.]
MQNEESNGPPPAYLIGSVDNALQLLLFLNEHSELRVRDVAKELDVAQSTAHRILATLAWRGFVVQDRGSKTYRAGRVLVEIALESIKELDVRRKARAHMERLSRKVHETVNLIVLEDDGVRFIDGVEGDQMVRVSARTGTLLPAYATSGGKILLAELTPGQLRALYPSGLRKLTRNTVPDLAKLEAELKTIRTRGYSVNIGETQIGLWAVAVAIRDKAGQAVAALAIATPTSRMEPSDIAVRVQALRETAEALSADLL